MERLSLHSTDRRVGPGGAYRSADDVWTHDGPVFGVIARKPIHLLTEEERKQAPKMKDLWLDIGAANHDEAAGIVRSATR